LKKFSSNVTIWLQRGYKNQHFSWFIFFVYLHNRSNTGGEFFMKISRKTFYILALSSMITFSNVSMASAHSFKLNLYKYGMSHSDVNVIQNKLKENGYLNISKTTNYYGSVTKSSVIKFQKASGLSADGIAGKNTLGKLFESSTQTNSAPEAEVATTTTGLNIQKQTKANLNMRSGAGTSSKIILTIPKGSKVNVISQSGNWSYVEYNGKKGHVSNSYLTSVTESTSPSNNDAPNRGTNVSREGVTAIDWSIAQNEVPRGATFVVEDYKTGIRFNMKRTYGTNHADIEALTKEDTQKIKQVWGSFSWTRRPVIVHIDNKQIIASMSAMPHAGRDDKPANVTVSNRSNGYGSGLNLDTVKGNGMDGHVDLHFLNSRTHGTKVKDTAHQNNIKELMNIFSR
jgi:peptidoglycan hydrolase-like protein with peptidoglycan-binding domain